MLSGVGLTWPLGRPWPCSTGLVCKLYQGDVVTTKKTVKSNAPAKWDEDELRYIHHMKRFCVSSIGAVAPKTEAMSTRSTG